MKTLNINIPVEIQQMDELSADDRRLVEKAIAACENSWAPYSDFHVGACLRLKDGTEIIGANQENAAYPSSLCAERTAIYAAQAQYPDQPVMSLAIAARNRYGKLMEEPCAPCGSCRQSILEVEDRYKQPIRILLHSTNGVYIIRSIQDLLPLCFISSSMD